MKNISQILRGSPLRQCLLVALLIAAPSAVLFAGQRDLSDAPLANVSGTTPIAPNIMFLMDDSGSMAWDFTPDHVDNSSTSLTPKYSAVLGDPPYMAAQFNKQYYNPNVRYTPPVGYDGSATQDTLTFPAQNRANTTNWTSVRTDGFNKQNKDQRGNTTTTFNIAASYPDRVYCTDSGDAVTSTTLCKTNDPGFLYADGHSNLATGNFSVGKDGSNVKYRLGSPYYYNILPWEYCQDAALTTCVTVTPGSAAPSGYPYASTVRWCNSSANANMATPAVADCRGKRGGTFTTPRFSPQGNSGVSYGTISVETATSHWCTGTTNSSACNAVTAKINEITVNGVSIIGTNQPETSNTGGTRQNELAKNIAKAINDKDTTPEYQACVGNSTSYPGCGRAPFNAYGLPVGNNQVTVVAMTASGGDVPVTDNSRSGFAIAVTPAPAVGTVSAWVKIRVNHSGNSGTGNITSIKVGPVGGPYVEVLGGPLSSNFDSNSDSNRKSAGRAICNRINSFTNAGAWEYTANTGTSASTSDNCSNDDDLVLKAPASAGSDANDYEVLITPAGSSTSIVTNSTNLMQGGYTRPVVATSTTSFIAGSSAVSAFSRVNIVPSTTSYPKTSSRIDCTTTSGICTYDEEMTNFANWYAYYRTRNQTMKSAAGHAFLPIGDGYRLGFSTINNTSFNNTATGGTNWLPSLDLTSTHKNNWYNKMYATLGGNATPLRGALNRMGKYFEGTQSGANSPIQYSCQRNYTILTTDGYWNETFSSSTVGDADNVNDAAQFCTRANGCFDGATGATSTLSDVAAYYYRTDLRTDMLDNVPVSAKDPNPAQHMTTFTLGLGVDGVMSYRPDYETATTGDFYRIRTGDSGCEWASGVCNWPVPANNSDTAVDDLWHAAVSGHGQYFSAQDPASLAAGLSGTLNALQIKTGAAAASSTSTPNITQQDNLEFSATFRTVKWDGELVAQRINTTDGTTAAALIWSARDQLQAKAGNGTVVDGALTGSADSRVIFTTTASGAPAYRDWSWDNLNSTERAWFTNKCAGTGLLGQCVSLTSGQKDLANSGAFMLDYLRGQKALQSYQVTGEDPVEVFRNRDFILGDIAGSKPTYVPNPRRKFSDTGYSTFASTNSARDNMIYVGSNGGMLHAINVADGTERWAYVPRIVMPNLYQLASTTYGTNHRYFVDGSPSVSDVYIGGAWKTLLVGGLNKGGRGYYALDITDPADPKPLWEICSDSALCPYRNDADMGFSFSEPIITKRPSDGKWVVLVTSGYNNVSTGTGKGYLYVLDAANGTVLNKITTNEGDTTTPSGLGKIADYVEDADTDSTSTLVYGGDLLGNAFRFDLTANTVVKMAVLTDLSGAGQPITTRPETAKCGSQPLVFFGTGAYLGASDVSTTQLQGVWGVKDSTTALGTLRTTGTMVQQTLSTVGTGATAYYKVTNNPVDFATKDGWFVDLDRNSGERVNLDPVLVNKNLMVLTNKPTSDGSAACGTGGKGFFYQFSYCNGGYLSGTDYAAEQVGQQVSDSIVVGFTPIGLPSGRVVVKITTADGVKLPPVNAMQPQGGGGAVRRISWHELND